MIPLLQRVQAQLGYLPVEGLEEAAKQLRIPVSCVYGVATFYSRFTLHPRARHLVQLCQGTACHVQGSGRVLGALEREPELTPGRTMYGFMALGKLVLHGEDLQKLVAFGLYRRHRPSQPSVLADPPHG
ncbi:NAD(P)H-dependent oxidoreductase subunit E [Candidatus Bipolaricaulota bacterium]|nr:NAD(P)H-dependent oxidoreductase subunit E [Candidatus Bipolaricaulota bacterium]